MGSNSPMGIASSTVSTIHPDARPKVAEKPVAADGKSAPAKPRAGSFAPGPAPRPATPEPREKTPILREARERVFEVLKAKSDHVDIDPAKLLATIKAVDDYTNALHGELQAQKAELQRQISAIPQGVNLEPATATAFQTKISELTGDAAEAQVLQELTRTVPSERIPRGKAQIASMRARASMRQVAEAALKLPSSAETLSDEQKSNIMTSMMKLTAKSIKDAEIAVGLWNDAKAAAAKNHNSDEARLSAAGHVEALEKLKVVKAQADGIKEYLKLFAGLLSPEAAKEAQLAFHVEQVRLLDKAEKNREGVARNAASESENTRQRREDTKADAQERELNRLDAKALEEQRDLAELETAAANEKFQQDRERRTAEVAKREGTTPRSYE